uniref:Thiol:disulfide interchange protein n=1 Tax=Gastroclonium compressum TaxID=1852973 RepID=A0A173FZR8_GASCM|nr:thiol:disulfide interchange protein [Coeloseira compressa]ANH09526.1 thiol:disulfide interchange protein [Coeloseira compressa]
MPYINKLNLAIYTCQQNLSIAIYDNSHAHDNRQYIILFIGGILTSLNPCFISIFPILFSYINTNKDINNTIKEIILGISISMTIMIAISTILNQGYKNISCYIPYLTSAGTIAIGLNLLQVLYLPNLNTDKSIFHLSKFHKDLKNYIIGIILGFSSLSCTTSITFALGQMINTLDNITLSVVYIIIYVLGYISPILVLTNINFLYIKLNDMTITWNTIAYLNGCFILGLGVFNLLETLLI